MKLNSWKECWLCSKLNLNEMNFQNKIRSLKEVYTRDRAKLRNTVAVQWIVDVDVESHQLSCFKLSRVTVAAAKMSQFFTSLEVGV